MQDIIAELPEFVGSILETQKTTLQVQLEEIVQDTREKVEKEKSRDNGINVYCALVNGLFTMDATVLYAVLRELYVRVEQEKISYEENQEQAEFLEKENHQMTESLCKILCKAIEMEMPQSKTSQTIEWIADAALDFAITGCNVNITAGKIPWTEQPPGYTPEM